MNRRVLKVLCILLFLGGSGLAQNPETEQQTPLAGSAVQQVAQTAPHPEGTSAPQTTLQAAETDSLQFFLISYVPGARFTVDSVAADGAVRIRLQIPQQMAQELARLGFPPTMGAPMISQLTEGHFLGLSGLPESDRMMVFEDILQGNVAIENVQAFRVHVIEVDDGGQAVVRIGPAAAEHLKKGDTFLLVRPAGSTTAQLQATPDLVPVTDGMTQSTGMDSTTTARLIRSINNLKQIGLAMHNFHDVHRHLPPAVIVGPDGKPWHSWRVLLLPFLEQQALYDQYRFDEPWDGPNNKRLLEKVPPVYQDPIYGETQDAYTHYAVAAGKGTAFPPEGFTLPNNATAGTWRGVDRPAGARGFRDFRDGTSNTLLVGSVSPERKIPWMKPEDVAFAEGFPGLGQPQGFAAPYKTDQGAGGVFLFTDGSVTTIRDDVDITLLRNLIGIADGQVIGEFPQLRPDRRTSYQQILVLEIPRNKPGAAAKLTVQDLRAEESRDAKVPRATPAPADGEAARKVQSANNLKLIGLAIHNYHDVHRRFPPAYSTDQDGKPLLSWRVYVLPYLEQTALYEEFHLDEPWDSEHNKTLIARMPAVFRSPTSAAEPGMTNCLGVSGPQGVFPGREKTALNNVRDGTSYTLMLVEASDKAAVIWTKPDDFVPDAKEPKKGLLGLWKGGFHACLADGSLRFLDEAIDDQTLQELLTCSGGERIDPTRFRASDNVRPTAVGAFPVAPVRALQQDVAAPESGSRESAIAEIKKLNGTFLAKGFKSSWSPDGTRIVFGGGAPSASGDDAEGLAILDVESGKVVRLVSPGKDAAWSPGNRALIAYVTGYGDSEELWVVEAAGGTPRKVADGGFPTWSADGKTLFFQSRKLQKLMAVQVGAEKSEPTTLMDLSWWYPAISPDGKQVAHRSGNQLLVADISSGKMLHRWSFPGSGVGFLGGWSPDGKRIGFGGYGLGDQVGLWFIDVGSGRAGRLAAGPFTMTDWSRDGSKIALDLRSREGSEVWMIDAAVIEKLQFEELPDLRYLVPEGGVNELLAFIQGLREFRPATAQQDAEHRHASPAALKAAAQRILQLEKDEWSEAYQVALHVLLEDRIRNIGEANPDQRQVTIKGIQMLLTAKLEREIEREDVKLALSAAQALEQTDSHELAAEAYRNFAELAARGRDKEITDIAKLMAGAARRLELVGKPLELAGTTVDGAPFDWAAYRGKVVLVNFWSTSCEPFRAELPNMKKHYERYHDRGFDVVGISLDGNREALKKFLTEEQLPWIILHEKDAAGRHPMAELYGVMTVPTMLLVDKEGNVVSLRARGDELSHYLEKLFGPPNDQ